MSLSRYRAQPQKGHPDRVKRIFGYLAYLPEGAIRFRTGEPDFSDIQDQEFDWSRTVYGSLQEIIPTDIPEPRGKYVTTVLYVDANLHHDLVTGRAVTAILHIVNRTPTDWYSKRRATVETATYGSEFVAARIALDHIVGLWYTLNVSRCSNQKQKFHVWRQQICHHDLHHSQLSPVQKAPHFSLPQGQGSNCLEIPHVYLERWQDQPSRHSQQPLGVPSNLAPT